MKKRDVESFKQQRQDAEYVVSHAKWQRSRGRNPSEPYRGEKNPRKALALALQVMEFVWTRRAVSNIHVFKPAGKYDKGGVTVLTPSNIDDRYENRYSEGYTEGSGYRDNPFQYLSAAPVSPHYGIVDLWSRFRNVTVFIKINDWLLEVSPDGVTASDGHFTKLA